jgi:hypothetical protein
MSDYPVITRNDLPEPDDGTREYDVYKVVRGLRIFDTGETVIIQKSYSGTDGFYAKVSKDELAPLARVLAAIMDGRDNRS